MASKEGKIAVFDSGVGGISVLRELVKCMPGENFLYFGDSANAPYGGKSPEEVCDLTLQAVQMLLSRDVKALVVACNTATAVAIGRLREQYPDTIIIGIEPALKLAADRYPAGKIGIMATKVTLKEEKLAHQLERFPQADVARIAAPGLVKLIESGVTEGAQVEELLNKVLAPYVGKLDALVLGCTHYPFVKPIVAKILGEKTELFDGGEGTARHTRKCLEQAGLLNETDGSITIENSLGTAKILEFSYKLLDTNS